MIILDLEATSPNTAESSILSIAALEFENPTNTFYVECRANENALIEEEALKVAGFTREQISDINKPLPKDAILKYIEWAKPVKDKVLGGFVVHMDFHWMSFEMMRSGIDYFLGHKIVDLHSLGYQKYIELNKGIPNVKERMEVNTDMITSLVGFPNPKGKYNHNALMDVELYAECISRILYGTSIIESYSKYPVPDYLQKR